MKRALVICALALIGCNDTQDLVKQRETLKKELFAVSVDMDNLLWNSSDDFSLMNCRKIVGKHGINTMAASASIHGNTLKISTRASDYRIKLSDTIINEPVLLNEYTKTTVEMKSRTIHGVKLRVGNTICRTEKFAELSKKSNDILEKIHDITDTLRELRKGSPEDI